MIPFSFASAYNVNRYLSYAVIGYGSSFNGSTRSYSAGYNFLYYRAANFYDKNGKLVYSGNSRMRTLNVEDTSVSCIVLGYSDNTVTAGDSVLLSWGYLPSANRFYGFSTEINGTKYQGQNDSVVIMSSSTDDRFYN